MLQQALREEEGGRGDVALCHWLEGGWLAARPIWWQQVAAGGWGGAEMEVGGGADDWGAQKTRRRMGEDRNWQGGAVFI